MRLRRVSPLLLLLAPSLVSAASEHRLYKRDAVAADANPALRQREATPQLREVSGDPAPEQAANPWPGNSQKPYRGTEDAPVDGEDGKPKVGPFVDYAAEKTRTRKYGAEATTTDTKARPTSLDRFKESSEEGWKLEDIPEKNDGVMNDENRIAPKKGTDGTAGGISEKEKERKAKGFAENKPHQPKEAPELPHSEQEQIEEEQKRKTVKENGDGKLTEKEKAEFGEGGYGLEKPTDLPDRPHSNAYTESQNDPAVEGGRGSWLTETMPYTEGKTNPKKPPVTKPDPVTGVPVVVSDEESWHEWFHSFVLSFTMIIFSEIGDKTFLVAALMAMRHPRLLVFSAALGALVVMTVLSAVLGHAVPTLLPKRLTTFAAAVLFLVFGARMLREGLAMDKNMGVGEEMKEVEAELEEKEHSMARDRSRRRSSAVTPYALESGRGRKPSNIPGSEPSPPSSRSPSPPSKKDRLAGLMNLISLVLSPAWVQTFVMTFLGEWGDRSQIATIAMAAGQDYWLVTLGAIAGHACCTGMAVIGGAALAGRVSMRVGKSCQPPSPYPTEQKLTRHQSPSAAPSPSSSSASSISLSAWLSRRLSIDTITPRWQQVTSSQSNHVFDSVYLIFNAVMNGTSEKANSGLCTRALEYLA